VPRDALVGRVVAQALACRVCVVRAPGGYGKTTLLSQVVAHCEASGIARGVWMSLSEAEVDVNRLVVLLLCALNGLQLRWPVDPQLLASQVQGGGPQIDAAVAVIVNALASWHGERLLLVIDDFQHVKEPAACGFLAMLIDLMPPDVTVIMGARTVTGLPLARWRMRRELAEMSWEDLAFTVEDARAWARLAVGPDADTDKVDRALRQSDGWVAGMQLLIGSRDPVAPVKLPSPGAEKALFDYFAQESLAGIPAPLQEFLTQCSILEELSPGLCRAVSDREDAQAALAALQQHSLFVTVLDEIEPVLKLHDLFAAFLRQRLARQGTPLLRTLHARAAAAEQPMRAVTHWLAAHEWTEAVRQMAAVAPGLLAEGGVATVARWLAALPVSFSQHDADAQFLQALVASSRWDFAGAIGPMERAQQGYAAAGRVEQAHWCAVLLPRWCHALGLLDKGAALLARADELPLSDDLRLLADVVRVWRDAAADPASCASQLHSIASRVQADPRMLPAVVENLNVPHFHGMRDVHPAMRRLRGLCRQQIAAGRPEWQLRAMATTAWPELWQGQRSDAEAALADARSAHDALAVVPVMRFNVMAETGFAAMARGDTTTALAIQREACEQMDRISPGFSATWSRVNLFGLAQRLWAVNDIDGLALLWPRVAHPRSAFEYPVIDTQRTRFAGHMAWIQGDLDRAESLLGESVRLQQCWSLPTMCGDARPALAALRLERGDTVGAWDCFAQLLEEMCETDCIGPLLMESPALRASLVALVPQAVRDRRDVAGLLKRVADWQPVSPEPADALQGLSSREREVLEHIAAGASNQDIADALHISLHTVKRHVVNVLGKLQCTTRGQAAARWHAVRDGRAGPLYE
jgi:LuxR family transcriptional regulator, maltose regulon positive regulatory protein